jgi:peptide/nickel transport system ATP-binding protein
MRWVMHYASGWAREMTEAALLQVDNLRVAYGDAVVVDDVSFAIAPAACLGIIGESGAGKSQVFLALTGLASPRARVSGRASLAGLDLLQEQGEQSRGRDVAMIFQDPMTSLTPHLRIGEQIAEPLVAHRGMSWRDARGRAAALLDQVRMSDVPQRLRQYPHELSGGMRQRAMIAMALACDPKLLIADEPTTALDVSVQAQILALLRELIAERRMSLALVTHDMGVISALADEVLVMRRGSVVERGPTTRLLSAPQHDYTRTLLAAVPRMEGARLDQQVPPAARNEDASATLRVRALGVSYRLRGGWLKPARQLQAVDAVSFDVAPGEALGIVGESGSGKSTLTRALLRLTPAAAGEVVWLGRPLLEMQGEALRAARDSFQIVFQDPFASLDPTMTVSECVGEPLRALRPGMDAGERAQRVTQMLENVGLDASFAGRRSRSLSGGQCQRVAIARAMILGPKLLVCDEAVSALDVSIQAQILELLARMKRERGTSLIFVSHNLAVVRRLCERVLVMYLGRVVEAGPAEVLFRAPRHPYTRMLLESVPLLDPARERERLAALQVRGETPSALERPAGCVFRQRCPAAVERCATTRPETEDTGNSQQVACLRWRELTL